MPLIFIAGGARSGKSRTAAQLARTRAAAPLLIATSAVPDEDLAAQAASPRDGAALRIYPLPDARALAAVIREESGRNECVVVDSLTHWLGEWIRASEEKPQTAVDDVLAAMKEFPGTLIAVATEVGCGMEPESDLARRFRDEAGRMSQLCAAAADETYWMVFGCPLRVK